MGDRAPRVAVFDRDGSWVADLAGKGLGPGELQMIGGLWAGPADTIVVWDARQRKLAFIPRVSGEAREVRIPWGPLARPADGIGGRAVFELETGPISATDLEAFYAGMLSRWGADMRPEGGEEPSTAATVPLITRIVSDDAGCVWVGDCNPRADFSNNWAGSNYLVVNRRTGDVAARVAFPPGFTFTDVRGGLAAGAWEDADELHYAHVYEISDVVAREDCGAAQEEGERSISGEDIRRFVMGVFLLTTPAVELSAGNRA